MKTKDDASNQYYIDEESKNMNKVYAMLPEQLKLRIVALQKYTCLDSPDSFNVDKTVYKLVEAGTNNEPFRISKGLLLECLRSGLVTVDNLRIRKASQLVLVTKDETGKSVEVKMKRNKKNRGQLSDTVTDVESDKKLYDIHNPNLAKAIRADYLAVLKELISFNLPYTIKICGDTPEKLNKAYLKCKALGIQPKISKKYKYFNVLAYTKKYGSESSSREYMYVTIAFRTVPFVFPVDSHSMFFEDGLPYNDKFDSIWFYNIDTSNVKNFSRMFRNCSAQHINVCSFQTQSGEDFSEMFAHVNVAEGIEINKWNFQSAKTFSKMFTMSRLTRLNLDELQAPNIQDVSKMFMATHVKDFTCESMLIDNATNYESMFDCFECEKLDLRSMRTLKAINMEAMFNGLRASSLNISNFDTRKVMNFSRMFHCIRVPYLDASDLVVRRHAKKDKMFRTCYCNEVELPDLTEAILCQADLVNMFGDRGGAGWSQCKTILNAKIINNAMKDCLGDGTDYKLTALKIMQPMRFNIFEIMDRLFDGNLEKAQGIDIDIRPTTDVEEYGALMKKSNMARMMGFKLSVPLVDGTYTTGDLKAFYLGKKILITALCSKIVMPVSIGDMFSADTNNVSATASNIKLGDITIEADFSKVWDATGLCKRLQAHSINLSYANFTELTNFASGFEQCKITQVKLDAASMPKLTNVCKMFMNANIRYLNLYSLLSTEYSRNNLRCHSIFDHAFISRLAMPEMADKDSELFNDTLFFKPQSPRDESYGMCIIAADREQRDAIKKILNDIGLCNSEFSAMPIDVVTMQNTQFLSHNGIMNYG